MRALSDYAVGEWVQGLPLVHGFKSVRNQLIDLSYRSRRPDGLDPFMAGLKPFAGKTIAFTIAFNAPWVLDLMLRLAKRHLAVDALVVLDNSKHVELRSEGERCSRRHGAHYLSLPPNPEWHPCRSHGISLNWAYYNVIAPLRPKIFAFLDHDLLLLDRFDPVVTLGRQPFYGRRMSDWSGGRWGWFVWPGYSIFSFDAVEGLPLNFSNEMSRNFDTGGANWDCLYSRYAPAGLQFARERMEALVDPMDGSPRIVQRIDDWVHIQKASYERAFEGSPEFYTRVVEAIEAGARLAELAPDSLSSLRG